MRRNVFTLRRTEHWNSMPRGGVSSFSGDIQNPLVPVKLVLGKPALVRFSILHIQAYLPTPKILWIKKKNSFLRIQKIRVERNKRTVEVQWHDWFYINCVTSFLFYDSMNSLDLPGGPAVSTTEIHTQASWIYILKIQRVRVRVRVKRGENKTKNPRCSL